MKNSIDTKTLLQKAEEFAMLGHWQLDLETEELYWSEQIYRIHGVDPQDFIPNVEDGISFYYPDDREIVRHAVERAINEGTPFDVELRIIRRDGEVRYIRSRGEVEVDNVGVKKTLFGVFQDITENKMKQFELEEKEDFLETMMETLPDILFVKDENYKIVRANNNFISLYPEEQRDKIIGYTTIEHYQPEDRDEFLKGLK